jgi:hypothetical protein
MMQSGTYFENDSPSNRAACHGRFVGRVSSRGNFDTGPEAERGLTADAEEVERVRARVLDKFRKGLLRAPADSSRAHPPRPNRDTPERTAAPPYKLHLPSPT